MPTTQAGCFADGGVLGRIPKNRLYQTGLNILNWWPQPNLANVPAGQAYNFENTDPSRSICSAFSRSCASTTNRFATSAAASNSSSTSSRPR